MELTPENLDWITDVASIVWTDVPLHKKPDRIVDLPPLLEENVQWARRSDKHYIKCWYRRDDGLWKSHQHVVNCIGHDDHDFVLSVTRFTEKEVQRFYDENHVAPPAAAAHVEPIVATVHDDDAGFWVYARC